MDKFRQFVKDLGQAEAAKLFGVSQGMVSHWVTGRKPISPRRAAEIEAATQGQLRREELCPEVFGDVTETAA